MKPAVRQLLFGSRFTPAKLFLGDAQGVWFDRQDLSTMFQDAAGTTPCAVGSPVGLALDKSQGATRGPRLDNNGEFIGSTSGWTPTATPTVTWNANSNVTITASAAAAQGITQTITTVANRAYEVFYSGDGGANTLRVSIGATVIANGAGVRSGRYVYFATGAATTISFQVIATLAGQAVTANYFTVCELPGNHATQGTAASRPILAQDTAGRLYAPWDGIDDSMACASGGGATAGFFFCAAITVSGGAGAARRLYSDASGNAGYVVGLSAANQFHISAGNGVAFTACSTAATFPVGETHVVTAWDDGTNLKAQIDQGAVASVARPAVVAGTAGFTLMKDNGGASFFFNGRDYGMVYLGRAPTAIEIARTQRFMAARAGVTL